MQRLVQSSELAFRRNGQHFVVLQPQLRVFSLLVIALTSPLSFNFARCFTTADNSVFIFVSVFLRSRGRGSKGDAQLLVGLVIGCHVVLRLGRLVQHLVVRCLVWSSPAPLPCLSGDLSLVTFQCSVSVRDFALWGVDRATHGLPS